MDVKKHGQRDNRWIVLEIIERYSHLGKISGKSFLATGSFDNAVMQYMIKKMKFVLAMVKIDVVFLIWSFEPHRIIVFAIGLFIGWLLAPLNKKSTAEP